MNEDIVHRLMPHFRPGTVKVNPSTSVVSVEVQPLKIPLQFAGLNIWPQPLKMTISGQLILVSIHF
jgi:hypothetical protein